MKEPVGYFFAPTAEEQKKCIMRTFPFQRVAAMLAVLSALPRRSIAYCPFYTVGELRRTARGLFATLERSGSITASSSGMLRLERDSDGWLHLSFCGPEDHNDASAYDAAGKYVRKRPAESYIEHGRPHMGRTDRERL